MIAALGEKHNIPVLDLHTPLRDSINAGATGVHNKHFDSHMTAKAHKILADALATQLLARGMVPKN